jgi:hypothetical protein
MRTYLAYTLSIVSQFIHNPREKYMNAVMYILRYMKVASRKRILFTKNTDCQNINDTNPKG